MGRIISKFQQLKQEGKKAFIPFITLGDPDFETTRQTVLALVDAGDYDLDGHSELIFAISRYDLGGYVLAYDDFRKRAEFRFGYH